MGKVFVLENNLDGKGKQVQLSLINLSLPSSAHLAPALFARLLIMFSGLKNLKDSLPLNFLFETLERLIERFILTDLNFWHKTSLSFF